MDGLNITLGTGPPEKARFTMKDSVGSNTLSSRMEIVVVSLILDKSNDI